MRNFLILANGTLSLYRFRKELLEALAEKGRVYVSSPDDGFLDEIKALGVTFIDTALDRRGTNPVKDYALLRKYRKIMRETKPDIILTYTIKPNIYGNLAAKGTGIPIISTVTGLGESFLSGGLISRLTQFLYRVSFRYAARVVFQNAEDEELLSRAGIVSGQKISRVPGSGVNLEDYAFYGMPETSPVRFLYSGRLMKSKGIFELLEATQRLYTEMLGAFEVLLAGYYDGELEAAVKSAEGRGARHLGFVSDMQSLLRDCHCVILPSYKEGMSNALLEAAATGRPLITTNVSGCREIVDDGINGFLCAPRDAYSLYNCMKRFLALSPEERVEMGLASRKKTESEFDRKLVVRTMLDMIDEIISR